MAHRNSEWQLVFFTILTQIAVGAFLCWGLPVLLLPPHNLLSEGLVPSILLVIVLGLLMLGTLSAGYHLGRPIHAVFSLSNLHRSWLSREAILGSSFGLVVLLLFFRRWLEMPFAVFDLLCIFGGMILGLALVFGISRLYMLRTVPAWDNLGTPAAFFTTTFLLGTVAVATIWFLLTFWDDAYAIKMLIGGLVRISTALILLFSGLQLGIILFQALYLNSLGGVAAGSIRLLWTDLRAILIWRFMTAFAGAGILFIGLVNWLSPASYFLAFGLILVSEILGRFLFYGFYQREGF